MFSLRLPLRLRTSLPLKDKRRLRRAVAAVALAAATMLVVWTLTPRSAGVDVVVAAEPIAPGTELSAADVSTRAYPAELVPDDALRSPAEAVGKSAAAHLSPGSPVTASGLVQPREESLTEGQLLMPVTVTDEAAARTLQPGHRVRIYTAGSAADAGGGSLETAGESESADRSDAGSDVPGAAAESGSSSALVDMAVVSSVARESGSSLSAAVTVVTLIVTEQQAAALASVAGSGLHFALLN
ncbi:hypothetical protein GCM10022261_06020 [Brevibacterium daeguense]|uniref:SAF domain-containing protein n=1 Tax=Brevibacterium daeguense TaxID=909936 RepID=A0ABP8EGI1_9MICO|nr:SAF domain-containing protein [Brevibacterium daeguense]